MMRIRTLKRNAATAGIPVIVLSNLGQDSDVQRALEAGAAAYLMTTIEEVFRVAL